MNGIDVFVRELEKSKNIKMLDLRDNLLCGLVNNTRTFDAVSFEELEMSARGCGQKTLRCALVSALVETVDDVLGRDICIGRCRDWHLGGFFLISPFIRDRQGASLRF